MSVSVSMPQLGESVTEGTVTRWLKKEGERVEADEPLLEVSTDKVDTEIPSPASGILRGITVAEDETVAVGAQLAIIDDAGDGAGAAPRPARLPIPATPLPRPRATRSSRRTRRPRPRNRRHRPRRSPCPTSRPHRRPRRPRHRPSRPPRLRRLLPRPPRPRPRRPT